MFRAFALSWLLLGLVPEAATAQSRQPVRVGDEWVYRIVDGFTRQVRTIDTIQVKAVDATSITALRYSFDRTTPILERFTLDWSFIETPQFQYRPDSGTGVQLGLPIGSDARVAQSIHHKVRGFIVNRTGVVRRLPDEDIKTEAGLFVANTYELTFRQVEGQDATQVSEVRHVMWYAPPIKRWVRRVVEVKSYGRLREAFTEELIAFRPAP
jgi:hypothetical protein